MVIVFFALFHVLALKYGVFGTNLSFDPHSALPTVVRHFDAGWWIVWLVYPLGILASCFHLSNGFWTAAVTWGLTVSARAQRRWGFVCLGLFVITLAAGITALVAGATMTPEAAQATLAAIH
jgi:succinate dehydrogenase / fumarate reductase cytochrome b subunit